MEKIKIFLAIGEKDLINDKNEIGNFIRNLNDTYEDFGIYFQLITDDVTEFIEADKIKECQLFFILFNNDLSNKALEEFNIAYDCFVNNTNPKIATYVKTTASSSNELQQSVLDFMKRLDEELGHYYNQYENIDTVKLNIVMQLQAFGFKKVDFETKDGKLYLNEKEIMSLENIPMFFNNEQLKKLKLEYQELEKSFWDYREIVRDNPDDEEAFDKYVEITNRRNKVKEVINNLENAIISLESSFVEISSKGPLSQRQIYAKKCLEKGDVEEAKNALAFDEIKSDGERLLNLLDERKKEIQIVVNELVQRAEVLKLDLNNKNRFIEIEQAYEEAIRIEKEGGLERIVPIKYGVYLNYQKNYVKASKVLIAYIKYLESEELEIKWNIYDLLGIAYFGMGEYIKAETYMLLAIDSLKSNGEQKFFNDDLAYLYNNISNIYIETRRYEMAENYLLSSIQIMKEKKNRDKNTLYLISCQYNNLGRVYHNIREYKKAEQCYILSIKIITKIGEENIEGYEEDCAMTFNNLAINYFDMKLYEEAEKYYLLSKEIREALVKENPNKYNIDLSVTYSSLGLCYKAMQKFIEAEKYLLLSVKILENAKSEMYEEKLLYLYQNLAEVYRDIEEYDKALDYINKGFKLIKDSNGGKNEEN